MQPNQVHSVKTDAESRKLAEVTYGVEVMLLIVRAL